VADGTGGRSAIRRRPRRVGDALARTRSLARTLRAYAVAVARAAHRDNLPFLASAITFNVLLAGVPFLLVLVSVASLLLRNALGASALDPGASLHDSLATLVPFLPREGVVADVLADVVRRGRALGLVSFALFLWFSTRLFASLRTVLRQILGLPEGRGLLVGKFVDVAWVLVSSALFLVNVAVTVTLNLATARGIRALGWEATAVGAASAFVTSFLSVFGMFLVLYRYVPAHRVPWGPAAAAAAVAAVGWEVLKFAFSFYLTHLANFASLYGNLATLFVVVLWLYYSSIVFLVGAEVAHIRWVRGRPSAGAGER
jgi:membrane protein